MASDDQRLRDLQQRFNCTPIANSIAPGLKPKEKINENKKYQNVTINATPRHLQSPPRLQNLVPLLRAFCRPQRRLPPTFPTPNLPSHDALSDCRHISHPLVDALHHGPARRAVPLLRTHRSLRDAHDERCQGLEGDLLLHASVRRDVSFCIEGTGWERGLLGQSVVVGRGGLGKLWVFVGGADFADFVCSRRRCATGG